ncbi:MAG TPA: YIP1 family protein [Rubrobacter sp.]|nr:YIP1 family protein [Rubrobacter sp.]
MSRARYGGSPEDFWGALRGVWLAPGQFFAGLDPDAGFVRPTLFASMVLYLDLLLESALQALWIRDFNVGLVYALFLGLVVALVLAPLLVAGVTVLVQVVHSGGPSRRDFRPLYRHLAYATGIGIVLWIPFGPFLAIPYGAYVITEAVKTALNTDGRRAAAAALIPLAAVLAILLLLTGPSEAYELLKNPPGS